MDAKAKMQRKVAKVMREYKAGKLKSSSGDKVTSQKQAVAIAMSRRDKSRRRNERSLGQEPAQRFGQTKAANQVAKGRGQANG